MEEAIEKAPVDLAKLASHLRAAIYMAWRGTLIGSGPPFTTRCFERMKAPQLGDLVAEWTGQGRTDDILAVGYLERITREKVDFGPGVEPWDDEHEGRPHPTETVHYIRALDGTEVRWVNCQFIAAITDRDFGSNW